ncbi:MAG TPA: hypothetical protein VK700_21715 [Steroidobacteraceae bacterium]|jgi:hypothetical protein|nr:hypothetical protein [Steroidobacteraceae bacterium]
MEQFKAVRTIKRRQLTRQWLGIEVFAYVLVCVSLITVAWTHDTVSGVAVLTAWVLAEWVLGLLARAIYRARP